MSEGYFIPRAAFLLLVPIAIAIFGACGGGSGPENREFDLQIEDRKLDLDPVTIRVNQGDTVTLRIDSDEEGSVHLHGYDIKEEVVPGDTATMTLVANATGRFSMTFHPGGAERDEEGVESHEGEDVGHVEEEGEIPVGALEVHPR